MFPSLPVAPVGPIYPVIPVGPIRPVGPVFPVGPSITSKFILYIKLPVIFPLTLVISDIINSPVDFIYVYTIPSKLFPVLDWSTHTIELPGIYDKFFPIKILKKLLCIISGIL